MKKNRPMAIESPKTAKYGRPTTGWNLQRVTTSPGEVLAQEYLEPMGLSQRQLARSIRVPESRIGGIVRGERAMTAETALRLARFFDNSAEFWLNLQQSHDLSKAKLTLGRAIASEVQPLNPSL